MKNPRKRLTEDVIKAAPYADAGQVLIRDSIDIGLVLRLTPGSKTLCFEGIGQAPHAPGEARQLAGHLISRGQAEGALVPNRSLGGP